MSLRLLGLMPFSTIFFFRMITLNFDTTQAEYIPEVDYRTIVSIGTVA